jgi:hypothetical protein
MRLLLLALAMGVFLGIVPGTGEASTVKSLRFGYLDGPGSDLCRIAAKRGHYIQEGLTVELVRFTDTIAGLAALESGYIDVGAFTVGESLNAIAAGRGFRIIAGGGTPQHDSSPSAADEPIQVETESRGIVVLIPPTWPVAEKGTVIQLTAALIRAYRSDRTASFTATASPGNSREPSYRYDPNPDYWRLERLWRELKLQTSSMKRDFLANHVYEEIFCDALDRLLLGDIDPVLQELFSKAICTPNCCPANAAKL